MILCISLLVCGVGFRAAVGFLNIWLEKLPVDLREHFASIPRTLGEWEATGEDLVLDTATVEALGTVQYLDRTYVRIRDDAEPDIVQVHFAYYTGVIDAVPHVPDRCLQAGGLNQRSLPKNLALDVDRSRWPRDPNTVHHGTGEMYPTTLFAHHVTGRPVRVHLPLGEYEIRTTEFGMPTNPAAHVIAGYFFIANGAATASPGGVKKLAFDPREQYSYYCKVQYTMVGEKELDVPRFLDTVSELSEVILPRLMQCLPDWPEIEKRMHAETADVQQESNLG